jgi:hypothetical protein
LIPKSFQSLWLSTDSEMILELTLPFNLRRRIKLWRDKPLKRGINACRLICHCELPSGKRGNLGFVFVININPEIAASLKLLAMTHMLSMSFRTEGEKSMISIKSIDLSVASLLRDDNLACVVMTETRTKRTIIF